jgi:WhiB family redox-sensing transcriptional regulator
MKDSAWDDDLWALKDADMTWRDDAYCLGSSPELFYFEAGQSKRKNYAVNEFCAKCDVRERCLEFALNNEERFGVWGGLTPAERNRILSDRRKAATLVFNPVSGKFERQR